MKMSNCITSCLSLILVEMLYCMMPNYMCHNENCHTGISFFFLVRNLHKHFGTDFTILVIHNVINCKLCKDISNSETINVSTMT